VITEPRNFFTTRLKKGSIDKVLLGAQGYNAVGCPYVDPKPMSRMHVKEGYKLAGHDLNFKPAKTVHTKVPNKLPYEYKEQGVEKKKVFKDEEGKVIIGPPNFYTTNPKKGQAGKGTAFSTYEHKEEDPNAAHKIVMDELAYHKSHLP
jgi:hypothetical protein